MNDLLTQNWSTNTSLERIIFPFIQNNQFHLICRIEQFISISLYSDVDLLIGEDTTDEYYMLTPISMHHVASSITYTCAARLYSKTWKYWPFMKCMME